MSVVTGALGSIGPKLLQLLQDEYKLQKGIKKQVQWLSDELESVNAFLGKVAEVPWDRLDDQVKVWARHVREASYDMEDVLDTFFVRVDGGDPADPNSLKRTMKKMGKVFSKAKARRDIAGAIEDIKKHLEEVAERRQKYRLDDVMSKPIATTSTIDPRLSAMYKEVKHLIGIDKSRDKLMSMLMPAEPGDDAFGKNIMKKVSIVGVGGLGKTTLAKAVYDKLKSKYDCGAFVSVGQELDLVKVFKDILFHLDKCKYENIHNDGRGADLLICELRQFLENKRYFVVVDDIWEVKTLEIIKLALVENNCGSRIITTTRKFDVAKEAGDIYKLQPLSYDDSKKLLYTRIFGADDKNLDNESNEVFNKILKKCGGIPLAIITMASLLVGKQKYEWSEVFSSIGFGHNKDNRDVDDTMMILSFSYYDLPSHLRTCLLYLSTYPEDYGIDKDTLIWKWIAEGFVHGEQGTRLFELGEGYFNDLINRSMIQAVDRDFYDDDVICFRVHDMVLELMRKFSIEENFVAALDDNVVGTYSPSNVRRLSQQSRTAESTSSEAKICEMPKVRSYSSFRCYINNWGQFLTFKLLRVLDVVDCSIKDGFHLEPLGTLLHLRYLGICYRDSEDIVVELPKQVGDMKLLQTLELSKSKVVLPESIVRLTQLVCLRSKSPVPDGIGKLTSLEELTIINCSSDNEERFVKELGSLRGLRVLRFSTDGMDEIMQRDLVESLCNLKKIQYLEVIGLHITWEAADFVLSRPLRKLHVVFTFPKLPSCFNPSRLPSLSCLNLYMTAMDEHDLKLLARLPALRSLWLDIKSTTTSSNFSASDGCFQNLRYFGTNAMVQFEQPNVEDSSVSLHIWPGEGDLPFSSGKRNRSKVLPCVVMPNLQMLGFQVHLKALMDNNYDEYGNIGFEHLPSLQEVEGCINCGGPYAAEGDAALAALRNACRLHPNHPTLDMSIDMNTYPPNPNFQAPTIQEEQREEAQEPTATVDDGKLSLPNS